MFKSKSFLAFIVFPTLAALSFKTLHDYLYLSRLDVKLQDQCPHTPHKDAQYRISYIGNDNLDVLVCYFVAFFQRAMESQPATDYLAYVFSFSSFLFILPAVEAARSKTGILAYPIIWGLLTQTITAGVAMPLYWLCFILSGALSRRNNPQEPFINQAYAEAIVFGVVIGAAIPSVAMLIFNDPYITAIWQLYPIYVSLAQFLHLQFRTTSELSYSGYPTIRALYVGAFIIASSTHISTILPLVLQDRGELVTLLLPSHKIVDSISESLFTFLKWDISFCVLSSIAATMWFANNTQQLFKIMIWYIVSIPLFGPGAAIMAVALWRESSLHHN